MRRLWAPEVVQTSTMDCGPAALKCLLEGFGIRVSYDRLREACQTGIDGTSIDTMEEVANQLGLEAEQVMLPLDHLFLGGARTFPAIVVVQLPHGLTHFVVVWRRYGKFLQVMDPATGRRWITQQSFLNEVFAHQVVVPAGGWLEFAQSPDFRHALAARHQAAGVSPAQSASLLAKASEDQTWRGFSALDAATRLVTSLSKAKALQGQDAARLIAHFVANSILIPSRFWSAREGPSDPEGNVQVVVRGAVLVRIHRRRTAPAVDIANAELAAALTSKPIKPGLELFRFARESGSLSLTLLLFALLAASGGVIFEALLFRGLFDVIGGLGLAGQRMAAAVAVLLFSVALLLLEMPSFNVALRAGRQVENRLRLAFLEKIPKLSDRYFQSRLTSDMAERSHAINRVRNVPMQINLLLRNCFELLLTGGAIVWIEPAAAPFIVLAIGAALISAFAAQPLLAERDLRARTHAAGLTRFYLDAMLGLSCIRAHSAARSIRGEQGKMLGEWTYASLRLQKTSVVLEAFQLVVTFGLIALLLLHTPMQGLAIGRVLLLVYWALNLPVLGQEIGALARQYPSYRNLTLRLLEPLGAAEQESAPDLDPAHHAVAGPVAIDFRDVAVEVSGHSILREINLCIEPGFHVAVVGPSGAGKSSLIGTLLGWLQPCAGGILVDGQPIDCERLRSDVAWVDPAVQIWNRSLLSNLTYGTGGNSRAVGHAIEAALLRDLLEKLPQGLQTRLGEGGALVSGGEGQRVRFARALLRPEARLVLLDEPFRGLDRDKRRELLLAARHHWETSTLLCVTHDVSETLNFDRVLVVENGTVVEDGSPRTLARTKSRYSELLSAEEDVRSGLWSQQLWRRIRMHSGRIVTDTAHPVPVEDESLVSS